MQRMRAGVGGGLRAAVVAAALVGSAGPSHAQAPAQAPAAPAAMIVFDGSGSMWGRIDGDKAPKFGVARETLRTLLAKSATTARLGLVSFGHRRKGDCSDVEVIAAAETGALERIMDPLDKLNPKGKGPLAQSLREAAKAMADKGPASLIVIHDNADNCQQDVCAAAEDIAKAHPGLKAYVVGIMLEADEAARMACVPKAMGGKLFNAPDAAGLAAALGESLDLALQSKGAHPAATTAKAAPPPAQGVKPLPADTPPGLGLAAVLVADGAAVTSPVRWRVTKESGGTRVLDVTAPDVFEALPPGKYGVEARAGLVTLRQTVDVGGKGPTRLVLPLNAGVVKITARAAKGGEAMAGGVLSILPAAADGKAQAGAGALWLSRETAPEVVLPAGTYVVRAEAGLAVKDVPVTVAAGSATAVEVVLGSGRVSVWAQAAEDADALEDVTFTVLEDDPDAPQGKREVARSAAQRPEFVLPAGTYYVTARVGSAEVRQQIALGAGDTVKRAIVLGLSRLTVALTLDGALAKADPPVTVRINRADGVEVARSFAARSDFMLTPGRYRIAAQAGGQNARAEGEVELKAGRGAQAAIRLEAASVALKAAGVVASDAVWEIRDTRGRLVWRTGQAEPKALLAPGRYVVRTASRDKQSEMAVDLAAGDNRTLEVGP